jgi:ferredoxin
MKAATNGAIYKRSDGLVVIDPVKSVGQTQVVKACPYGEIWWNASLNIPQKCTGCAHIMDAAAGQTDPGLTVPRCVDSCPHGAITIGEDSDPAVQALILESEVLHPEYGTQPRVHYLNMPKYFIAGSLADTVADECVEGATVTATDLMTGQVYTTMSDNYGDFWFEGLDSGKSFQLDISMTGYLPKQMVVFVNNDKNVGDIELFAE